MVGELLVFSMPRKAGSRPCLWCRASRDEGVRQRWVRRRGGAGSVRCARWRGPRRYG
jgi:hypothetical protein